MFFRNIKANGYVQYLFLLGLLFPLALHFQNLPETGALPVSDTFRYLWMNEFSFYFFKASSLSVRSINLLFDNDRLWIGNFQLLLSFLPAVLVYLVLKRDHTLYNLVLIGVIIAVYTSPGVSRFHDNISSESVYSSLFISFTLVLFGWTGKFRFVLLLVTGVLFIFSRNPAPYIVLVQLMIYLVIKGGQLRDRKMFYSWLFLLVTSFAALILIQKFDTTKEINVADNLFSRIYPFPDKAAYFHEKYGMPYGPFINTCKKAGNSVNDPCVDHESIYTGDNITRQYRLTNDYHGLSDWIRDKGMKAWQDYILFRDTRNTIIQFNNAFSILAVEMFTIRNPNPGSDPLVRFGRVLGSIGALTLVGLSLYITLGIAVYYLVARHKGLEIALVLMVSAIPAFFIGYYGDSEEVQRYTYPAILCLYLGLLLYLFSLADLAIGAAARLWKRRYRHIQQ